MQIEEKLYIYATNLFDYHDKKAMNSERIPTEIPVHLQSNPLLTRSTLPFQAPDFKNIKNEDFQPAFEYGLKIHRKEIECIAQNKETPTFENTVLAIEVSGEVLKRAQLIFSNVNLANTNSILQKLDEDYAPIFSAHHDFIELHPDLYRRCKAVDTSLLDAESKKLTEFYIEKMEMAGANLEPSKKEKLQTINTELATLCAQFTIKLLNARKNAALVVDDVGALEGLSEEELLIASKDAQKAGFQGKFALNIQNTTQQPLLQNIKKRETRKKLFYASWLRAEQNNEDDTRACVEKIALLRLQKAKILGKESFAAWKLQDQMAKNPENAMELMLSLAKSARNSATVEAKKIQNLILNQGDQFELEAWDWNFYSEQIRKSEFDMDENLLKPYLELQNVLEKGVFFMAEKFYGLRFQKREEFPVYVEDVIVYEVLDKDGESLALLYFDFYARENKGGGAWMSNLVEQSTYLAQKPVIINAFNFQKPMPDQPTLLSMEDVDTMFHEFGHTLHGMFSELKYVSLSGTNTPTDFVEFPSQIHEYFALEPEVLKNYALHYHTQEPMPLDLVEKIKKANTFNQGYATTEIVSAAILDMQWHTVTDEKQLLPCLEFEKKCLENFGFTLSPVPPRYHSPYFAHSWGGYAASYYAYIWSDVLTAAAWEYISKNGGMTRENGDRFRTIILSVGNSVDLNQAYQNFTGTTPEISALLRAKGFLKV